MTDSVLSFKKNNNKRAKNAVIQNEARDKILIPVLNRDPKLMPVVCATCKEYFKKYGSVIYALLTKREVEMAGYIDQFLFFFFFAFLKLLMPSGRATGKRSINICGVHVTFCSLRIRLHLSCSLRVLISQTNPVLLTTKTYVTLRCFCVFVFVHPPRSWRIVLA